MLPNEKLTFGQVVKEGKIVITLKGIIDEDSTFDDIRKLGPPFVFNFKEVTAINSCGVRNWVNFVKELTDQEVWYEECPPLIVRQMNMVPSFMGHAQIASVFVPYVCDGCEAESLRLVNRDLFAGESATVEESFLCSECQKEQMVIDGDTTQYFAFSK